MGISTVRKIICGVVLAVCKELIPEVMPVINTVYSWSQIASGFGHRWQFPHYCGALDRKHCVIQWPPKTGSLHWNYKKTFSITMIALVDSRYRFIMIDIGACGSEGDSNTFWNSSFGQQFMEEKIPFPVPKNLLGTRIRVLFAIIGDEAFPSMVNLLKPYPKRSKQAMKKARAIYNYRLSWAWICVECTFRVLLSQFHFLLRRMMLSPEVATICVQAAAVLHNFLIKDSDPFVQNIEAKLEISLQEARDLNVSGLKDIPRICGYHLGMEAWAVRNIFTMYFTSWEGHVPWQDEYSWVADLDNKNCKWKFQNILIQKSIQNILKQWSAHWQVSQKRTLHFSFKFHDLQFCEMESMQIFSFTPPPYPFVK